MQTASRKYKGWVGARDRARDCLPKWDTLNEYLVKPARLWRLRGGRECWCPNDWPARRATVTVTVEFEGDDQ